MEPIKCKNCLKAFRPDSHRNRYCGDQCRKDVACRQRTKSASIYADHIIKGLEGFDARKEDNE